MDFDTFAGAPDHERRSRGSPNTQLTATRSKRGAWKACCLSARSGAVTFMMSHRTTARRTAASDQPVTVRNALLQHHKLVTVRPRVFANTRQACTDPSTCARK